MQISKRAKTLAPSATLALDARAKELQAAGKDVVNMAVGEPDFPAPQAVQAAAVEKVQSGNVRYTPAAGTPELRATIARSVSTTRGVDRDAANVVVCHSAKHALSTALLATVQEGDDVVVPLPAWGSYFAEIEIAGARVVPVAPRDGCRPDLDGIERAITPATRLVMMNTPSNPTGLVWTRAELERLVALAERHDLWILSDEIYRRLVYGNTFESPMSVPGGLERTILVDGASKSFAMTGYRIGYLCAQRPLADAVGAMNSQMTGSPNAVSQAAYERALRAEPAEVAEMADAFAARRERLLAGLAELGLPCPRPEGAFYAFPDVRAHLYGADTQAFCADLLEEQSVALVPGEVFGVSGHVRLSYATSIERIEEALSRLGRFFEARGARYASAGASNG